MGERVIIDVEGKFTDGISGAAGAAISALERFARTKVFVKFKADSSPFLKVLNKAKSQAEKFGHSKLAARLEAIDKATRVMGKVWNLGLKIGGTVWRATISVVDKATAPLRGIFNLLKNPVLQAGAALGLSFGASNMISTYKDFEAAMSNVGAISGATGREMDALTAKAKEMGAATKFTATEASEAMGYMAMAGWKPEAMLNGIEGIMNLAAASGESLASTSDIVTDALTAFKMLPQDSGHFADVLAAASANANTNVGLMGETFKYVGNQAGTLGYSIEDVALATGLMANSGLKGSMAGTAMSAIWTRLSTNTSGATDAIKALGVEFYDQYGNARKWRTVMDELRTATAGMTTEQKTALAATVAGQEAQKGLFAILNASQDDYNKLAGAIDNSNGAALRMSKTMMDNLKGSLDLLKSAAEGAILTVMDFVGPHLRKGVDWLASKMPAAGQTVGKALDFVGTKFGQVADKIKEITESPDYKFGSIGEKIKLLWKGVVADPLSEWWNGGGREKSIETAGNIGRDLGEILKTGLLAIFGMTDALNGSGGEAMSAGASIAKSFVEGFAEGFDFSLVAEKLKAALSNIWDAMPGWTKALTGGIIGSKVIGGLSSVILSTMNTLGKTGNAYGGGTGILGTLAGKGYQIYQASRLTTGMTGAQAALLGGAHYASVAGIATAGITGITAIGDILNAAKAQNEGDNIGAKSNLARGTSKAVGIGIGAAAGAKFGAVLGTALGPAGTFIGGGIGAGIGSLVGIFAGNKIARNIEAARFESEEMQAVIKDTDMSAEDLAKTFDKAVYANMKSHFGDMALSLGEIKRLSEQIVFGDDLPAYNKFTSSVQDAEASLQSLQSAANQTDRWMWKAGLGVKFDESEVSEIQASFNDYIESAKAFVENKHYAFTAAVELLMDPSSTSAKGIIESGNAFYSGLQEQLDSLGTELSDMVKISLGDGIIDIDEQAAISGLQSKIASIMDRVANAKQSAQLDLIELKFGGGKLDLDSFDSFMSQMQSTIDERMSASDDAYIEAAAGIKLQLDQAEIDFKEGKISEENYNSLCDSLNQQFNDLNNGRTAKIDSLRADVMGVELNIIGDAYKDVLGKDATGKLSKALENSLKSGMDPIEWSTADAQKFLNTPNLSEESAGAISKMLSGVASQLKQLDVNGTLNTDFEVKPDGSIAEKAQSAVGSQPIDVNTTANVSTTWELTNIGTAENEIMALVSPDKEYTFSLHALAETHWTIGGDPLNPELLSPDGTQRVPINAEAAIKWTAMTGQEFDLSQITQTIPGVAEPVPIHQPVAPQFTVAEGSGFDASKITSQVPSSVGPAHTQVNVASDFTPASQFEFEQAAFGIEKTYPADITINITARFHPANSFTFSKSAFGIQDSYSASTNVSIKVNYSVDKSGKPRPCLKNKTCIKSESAVFLVHG